MRRRDFIGLLGGAATRSGRRVAGEGAGAGENPARRGFPEPNVGVAGPAPRA
jgi:hypothetical protein